MKPHKELSDSVHSKRVSGTFSNGTSFSNLRFEKYWDTFWDQEPPGGYAFEVVEQAIDDARNFYAPPPYTPNYNPYY